MFEKKYLEEVIKNLKLIRQDYEYTYLIDNIIEDLERLVEENY